MRNAQGQVPLDPPICVVFGEVYMDMHYSPSALSGRNCSGLPQECHGREWVGTESRSQEQSLQCCMCLCRPNESLIIRISIIFIFNYKVALHRSGQK